MSLLSKVYRDGRYYKRKLLVYNKKWGARYFLRDTVYKINLRILMRHELFQFRNNRRTYESVSAGLRTLNCFSHSSDFQLLEFLIQERHEARARSVVWLSSTEFVQFELWILHVYGLEVTKETSSVVLPGNRYAETFYLVIVGILRRCFQRH